MDATRLSPASPPPPPPSGLSASAGPGPGELTIARRWARPKHVLYLAAIGALVAYVVQEWMGVMEGGDVEPFLVIVSLIAFSAGLRLAAVLVNRTTIEVGEGAIRVHHGPLPQLSIRPASVARGVTRDFEASRWGPHHEVLAVDAEGARVHLVRPLVTAEQASYVRDALRRAWSLPDGEVPAAPEGSPAPARAGSVGMPAALPIVLVVGIVGLFLFMTDSDVEGTVRMGDGAGALAFAPDDCRSGVPRGFFGVELTSDESPGTVVRVVRDPTRGSMLAVERGGGAPQVFGPDACRSLVIDVEQTNTNVNDVWALRGSARAECEGLALDVRFDGCH